MIKGFCPLFFKSDNCPAFIRDQILYEIGTDESCVYTGSGGSGTDRICYLVPNGSTCDGDPMWNCTVPVWNLSRVNRVDPYQSGSDPKRI